MGKQFDLQGVANRFAEQVWNDLHSDYFQRLRRGIGDRLPKLSSLREFAMEFDPEQLYIENLSFEADRLSRAVLVDVGMRGMPAKRHPINCRVVAKSNWHGKFGDDSGLGVDVAVLQLDYQRPDGKARYRVVVRWYRDKEWPDYVSAENVCKLLSVLLRMGYLRPPQGELENPAASQREYRG